MLEGRGSDTLVMIVSIVGVVVIVQAVSRLGFLVLTGRVGQQVLLELRRRLFRHFQRLSQPSTTTTPPAG
jgi:ABC-type multidrug transport system fused ATPase/permease subunit